MDIKQYKRELTCTLGRFAWPPGYVPDLNRIFRALDRNPPSVWQGGFWFTFWSGWNTCAWYQAWLDARRSGNQAAERRALKVITNVTPRYPELVADAPAIGWSPSVAREAQDIANKATLGDPSGIQLFMVGNCNPNALQWQGKP